MAAGQRKIRVTQFRVIRGVPIMCDAKWVMDVEDVTGADREALISGGTHFQLAANLAAFNAMTGSAIRTAVSNAVSSDPKTPANDGISV